MIFILLFMSSAMAEIKVEENFFYKENNIIIDQVVNNINKHCKRENSVLLRFDYMPKKLEYLHPQDHLGSLNFLHKKPLIEIHRSNYDQLKQKDKYLVLYHEIGHLIGLAHKKDSIMQIGLVGNPSYKEFFKDIEKECIKNENYLKELF